MYCNYGLDANTDFHNPCNTKRPFGKTIVKTEISESIIYPTK